MRINLSTIFLVMFCITSDISSDVKFRTEEDVAAYADKITGFDFIKGIKKSFKREVIIDDNTPFLHKQIKGRNVWVAEYKDFKLELKSSSNVDKYKRNFKVYIDPNDGTILKITSKFDGYDPNSPKEPNAAAAERQLIGSSESYLGFPKELPKISFIDALNIAQTKTDSNPYQAKEIDALYIWHSEMEKTRRIWIITTRDIPPIPIIGGHGVPEKILKEMEKLNNNFRVAIDADTGKPLFGTINIPHPEIP